MGGMDLAQTLGGAGKVDFNHFGWARPHQKELANVRTARQKAGHFAVQLDMRVGHSGQILLFENRCTESGFSENHHTGGRLQQVRAGP